MGSESTAVEPVSGGAGGQEQETGRSDKNARGGSSDWSRFLGSLPTAFALIIVAGVGALINSTISSNQLDTQSTIARAQYTSDAITLQTNRETAQDSLRAEVFGVLAQSVVTEIEDKDFRKVALLAAFHGNFSQFIDTRPVFEAFLTEVWGTDARHELRRLAKRVARRQADYIEAHGGVRDRQEVHWRPGSGGEGRVFSLGDHGEIHVVIEDIRDTDEDGKQRPVDDVANTVEIKVNIDEVTRSFSVSYLDVPYIDNIYLVHSNREVHRIALLLLDITKTETGDYEVTLETLHIPEYSILPGDVPSAKAIREALDAPDSHESKEDHGAKSS